MTVFPEASQLALQLVLLLVGCCCAPSAAADPLSLHPLHTDTQRWPVGSVVRLPYVIRTSSDARVTCTRDGRPLNRFWVRVPPRGGIAPLRTVEHAVVIFDASSEHAGEYACWARTATASRSVRWQVRPVTTNVCLPAGSCRETRDRQCEACTCPPGRAFYARNRTFRCYNERPLGLSLRLKLTPGATHLVFHTRSRAAIYYELTTYGDTQVVWRVRGHLIHAHTTLYRSTDTYATFWERIPFRVPRDDPRDHDTFLDGLLRAELRGANQSVSLSLQVKLNHVRRAMRCTNDTDCDPIGAECSSRGICRCNGTRLTLRWNAEVAAERGECTARCSSASGTCPEISGAVCASASSWCACPQGTYRQGQECRPGECTTNEQCMARHGSWSECVNWHCECLAGYVYRDGVCEPMVCLNNDDCVGENIARPSGSFVLGETLRCMGGRCVCHHEFDEVHTYCTKGSLGACSAGANCSVTNSHCIDRACVCERGYRLVLTPSGRACARVSCDPGGDECEATRSDCVNGMCTCPGNNEPPRGGACYGSSSVRARDLVTPVKQALCALVLALVVVCFMCVTFTFMKSKEDYVSTLEDDQPVEDEGAIMAAKRALDHVQEQDRKAAKAAEHTAEEPLGRAFVRSFFPKVSDVMYGATGEEEVITFGSTIVSDNTIDI